MNTSSDAPPWKGMEVQAEEVRPASRKAGPAVVASFAAFVAVALGILVLVGWWLDLPQLKTGFSRGPRMPANSAVILILLGSALALVSPAVRSPGTGIPFYSAQVLASIAAVLGGLILAEHLFQWNPGLDQWWFKDPNAHDFHAIPGRPSYPSAMSAVALGLGIVLLETRTGKIWPSQLLAMITILIAFLALIGHAVKVREFYGATDAFRGTGMSIHGSIAMVLLGAGLLCARPDRGLTAVLWSNTPGGTLARWLIFAPPIGLLLTGVVYVAFSTSHPNLHEVRTWLLGFTIIFLLTLPIWATAQALHRAGLERDEAHRTLESRVKQRTAELTEANAALQLEIAERERGEQRLKNLLMEKDALLQEVHHRVKNNLQVISSLLRLQAMEIRDPGLLAIFEESRARIHAMALVHERLYRAGTLQAPDYRAFLKDLVIAVGRAFRQRLAEVHSEVEVEARDLDVAVAVPIGLIVNELVSNSLKHGFPGGRKGRILVRLEGDRENGYTLTVTDNGVGMPDGFAIEKAPSMGLRLVSLLTRQLQGEWDVQSEGGTRWVIRFGMENATTQPSLEGGTCQNAT